MREKEKKKKIDKSGLKSEKALTMDKEMHPKFSGHSSRSIKARNKPRNAQNKFQPP